MVSMQRRYQVAKQASFKKVYYKRPRLQDKGHGIDSFDPGELSLI
jgi:hypothetical protein